MSKKTSSPSPCCKARMINGDGLRLVSCPRCGKRWNTFTGQGITRYDEVVTVKAVPDAEEEEAAEEAVV